MILQRTLDTYCGMYDFATTGGAIGSYDLQVPIPKNSIITEFFALVLIAPVGAGAVLSFDAILISVSPVIYSVGSFIKAQPITTYTIANTIFGISEGLQDFNVAYSTANTLTPLTTINSPIGVGAFFTISVGFSISVAPLTAGRIVFAARGTSFDLPQ